MALEGTLRDFPLPDIIQLLSLSRKTGAVEIMGSDGFGTGKLYFHQGKVVSAALDDMPPLEAAYSFFTFPAASFYFHENDLPSTSGPPITVSNEFLIMEGIRRADEWEKLRERVPSLDLILGLIADPVAGNRDINLKPDEWRVLTMINGRDSIRQIARRTGFGDFKTTRIVYHLSSVGLIEPLGMSAATAPAPPAGLEPSVAPPWPAASDQAAGLPTLPETATLPAGPPAPLPSIIRPLMPATVPAAGPPPAPAPARPVGPPAPPVIAPAPRMIGGPALYARLEAISVGELGNTGRLMLSDTYKRMRLQPGADIGLDSALKLCDRFERDASMLVGSTRARLLAEKLRRAVNDFFKG